MFWNIHSFFHGREDFMFYIFAIIPIFLITILSGIILEIVYSKYLKVKIKNQISGADIARDVLDSYGLYDVKVKLIGRSFRFTEEVGIRRLRDHFDPVSNVVWLSYSNYEGSSISSIGVALHEVGHAIQHKEKYFPAKIRTVVVGISKFGFKTLFFSLIAGIFLFKFMEISRFTFKGLFFLSILFFLLLLFEFITLPVEFNASARAIKILKDRKILTEQELKEVKKILFFASMTYVVYFIESLLFFIYYLFSLFVNNNKDD